MRYRKTIWFICWIALLLSLLLSACQSGTRTEGESAEAASATDPQPTPAAETTEPAAKVETIMADSENGLLVNEDIERSALFKINTLAYEVPGMEDVEAKNITYAHREDWPLPLTMDVYYPPDTPPDAQLPAVVFGLGYKMSKVPLREEHFYTSWGKLVAASGMVAIAYDTEQPDQDLEILMAFIRENAAELRIDPEQIGFHSTSANPPTVMSYLMQEGRSGIQFAIYYYGSSLTPDRKYAERFDEVCEGRGCLYNDLANVTFVDPDVPLFIVKAGKDFVPFANEALDHFVDYVQGEGATVTVIEYEDGEHGFDTQQKTEESAQIIADTVAFMKTNFGLEP